MKKIVLFLTVAVFVLLVASISVFSGDIKKADIKVTGMTCNNCVESVKSALMKVDGVKSADVSLKKGNARVEYDGAKTDETRLINAITLAGFKTGEMKDKAKNMSSGKSGCCSGTGGCSDKQKKSADDKGAI